MGDAQPSPESRSDAQGTKLSADIELAMQRKIDAWLGRHAQVYGIPSLIGFLIVVTGALWFSFQQSTAAAKEAARQEVKGLDPESVEKRIQQAGEDMALIEEDIGDVKNVTQDKIAEFNSTLRALAHTTNQAVDVRNELDALLSIMGRTGPQELHHAAALLLAVRDETEASEIISLSRQNRVLVLENRMLIETNRQLMRELMSGEQKFDRLAASHIVMNDLYIESEEGDAVLGRLGVNDYGHGSLSLYDHLGESRVVLEVDQNSDATLLVRGALQGVGAELRSSSGGGQFRTYSGDETFTSLTSSGLRVRNVGGGAFHRIIPVGSDLLVLETTYSDGVERAQILSPVRDGD